jgi:RNA-directed DNA polymerase
MDEWKTIRWHAVERRVFKLQARIYRASQRGEVKTVRRLQRLLATSWSAGCLAVRRVTQDNQGKKTAGVDGVKSLAPPQRLALARSLHVPRKADPTRRAWIPKPDSEERRPLGVCRKPKYVLDADIEKCFDHIDHEALLHKLAAPPTFRRAINAWLKAGVLDGGRLVPAEAGTPHGGVISPLLANIALDGMERFLRDRFPRSTPVLIRYADDFVVLHQDLSVVHEARAALSTWLADIGLRLSPGKARVVHTLDGPEDTPPGFDFLGLQIRQHRVGKAHAAKDTHGRPLGFKTLVQPSKAAQVRHQRAVRRTFRRHTARPSQSCGYT